MTDASDVLGQYQLLEELGQGGFGCVFKARHALMGRVVAVKLISRDLVEDSRARKRFRREVLALTQLSHPNIVTAHDADEVDDRLFLVMEFVDGPNLHELVQSRGPLAIALACAMLQQAARALQHAHEMGLIHRDIKPANLLVPTAGLNRWSMPAADAGQGSPVLIKIGDFGLAQLPRTASSSHFNREKGFVGTPDYVSPEQARNQGVDIRSDLYSLGCTFYFALAGRKPFAGTQPLQIVVQHLEKEPTRLETLRPEVPVAVASIIHRLMAKDPDRRFQTPMDLIAELSFLVGRELGFCSSTGIPQTASNPCLAPPPTRVTGPLVPSAEGCAAAECPEDESLPPTLKLPCALPHPQPEACPDILAPIDDAKPDDSPQPEAMTSSPALSNRSAHALQCDEDLLLFWDEWKGVVDRCRLGKNPGLDAATYSMMHARLVEKARACSNVAGSQKRMESLLASWISLDVLAATDPETLASLLANIRAQEAELGLVRGHAGFLVRLLGFAAIVALGIVASLIFLPVR